MPRTFPDWLAAYQRYADLHECPTIFDLFAGLSGISAALGRKVWLPFGRYPIYPNLYVVLVSEPGGRKTTALRGVKPIVRAIESVGGVNMVSQKVTLERLMQKFGKLGATITLPSGEEYTHSSLHAFSDELGVLVKKGDDAALTVYTDWYDCDPYWVNDTKHQGVDVIPGVCFGMLAGTTPGWLGSAFPLAAMEEGFTTRVIFVCSNEKKRSDPMPLEAPPELLKGLQDDLAHIATLAGPFAFTDDAYKWNAEWYEKHEANKGMVDYRFRGYNARKQIHLLKIAMCLCTARSDKLVLTAELLQEALTVLEQAETTMPDAFGSTGRNSLAPVLVRMLALIRTRKRIRRTELVREFWREVNIKEMEEMLTVIQAMGACRVTTNGKSTVYEVIEGGE